MEVKVENPDYHKWKADTLAVCASGKDALEKLIGKAMSIKAILKAKAEQNPIWDERKQQFSEQYRLFSATYNELNEYVARASLVKAEEFAEQKDVLEKEGRVYKTEALIHESGMKETFKQLAPVL